MTRRGVTAVEVIVVIAILATLVGLLWPAVSAASKAASRRPEREEPPRSWRLETVQHDGHWFVMLPQAFAHHPDCPCRGRKAEMEVQ